MPSNRPPKIDSTDEVPKEISEILESIDSIDLGNLLNEETEKSRNAFLLVSLTNIVVSLFQLSEFKILGQTVVFSDTERGLVFVCLFSISLCLGITYRINFKSDQVSKLARRSLLDVKVAHSKFKLAKRSESVDQSVENQLQIDAHLNKTSTNKNLTDENQREKSYLELALEPLKEIEREFSKQHNRLETVSIATLCGALFFQILSALLPYAMTAFSGPDEVGHQGREIVLPN